jgi:hypothetical protein
MAYKFELGARGIKGEHRLVAMLFLRLCIPIAQFGSLLPKSSLRASMCLWRATDCNSRRLSVICVNWRLTQRESSGPTHKRTEGRAPVWGSELTSKDAT